MIAWVIQPKLNDVQKEEHYKSIEEEVVALVCPDRRGEGYGLSRFNDDKRMEFTKVGDEVDVHFAHNKGFIAKTSSADTDRLKVLINQSWIGA